MRLSAGFFRAASACLAVPNAAEDATLESAIPTTVAGVSPGYPMSYMRVKAGELLADLDAVLDDCPRSELPNWYAALHARIGVVTARMLTLESRGDTRPAKRFFRVREVMELYGLSKGKVFQALKEGKLDGRKLDGVVLITVESMDRYLASATPWKPNGDSLSKSN